MINVEQVYQRLDDNLVKADIAGFDPFDGLNSKLFTAFGGQRSRFLRLAWLQFHKRSPVNFRPMVGVPKQRNPKGVALYILSKVVESEWQSANEDFQYCIQLADWLISQRCDADTWKGACWGYHFPWQARAFYVPLGTPNMITTVYVARALFALGEKTGKQEYIDIALTAADFIVSRLLNKASDKAFFAYIPEKDTFVHNASLWGAYWVLKAGLHNESQRYVELALEIANNSVQSQRQDGAWVYGDRSHHQFVDGFHTGYNLEALELMRRTGNKDFGWNSSIEKGLDYYINNFFTDAGQVKYYDKSVFPLDCHSVSQAILTLSLFNVRKDIQDNVLDYAITNMYSAEQCWFHYQHTKSSKNKVVYLRWTQLWMLYAMAAYLNRVDNE